MKCPSCNDDVLDNSQFCVNCGATFPSKVSEVQLRNTNAPIEIIFISVWFEKGMKKVKDFLGMETNKVTRNITFAIQLVDANKNSTAYDGAVRISGRIFQGYSYSTDNGVYGTSNRWHDISDSRFDWKLTAHVSDFYRAADQAKLWWKYTHPTPFTITIGHDATVVVEVCFTPNGGQKLYKKYTINVSST